MQPMITGIILAGGRSTRMGGKDKGLFQLDGKLLYQHVADKLTPQVNHLLINANRNISCYEKSGIPVFSDITESFSGPLAGMLAGLNIAATEWCIFVPCDVPDIPSNMVEKLWQGRNNTLAAYVNDGERDHPTLVLLHKSLITTLENYLANGERKLMILLHNIHAQRVIFNESAEMFCNLNTPEDCALWEERNTERQ